MADAPRPFVSAAATAAARSDVPADEDVRANLAEALARVEDDLLDAQRQLARAQEDAARLAERVVRLTSRKARLRATASELVDLGLVPPPADAEASP